MDSPHRGHRRLREDTEDAAERMTSRSEVALGLEQVALHGLSLSIGEVTRIDRVHGEQC